MGDCDARRRIIRIRRGLSGDNLFATLLHEMNHVGSPYHGKKFRAGMERLVRAGAPVAKEDTDRYWPATRTLVNDIESLALDHPELPWAKARKLLAREQGMTQEDFTRRFWWARKRWQKQIKSNFEYGFQLPEAAD